MIGNHLSSEESCRVEYQCRHSAERRKPGRVVPDAALPRGIGNGHEYAATPEI